MVTQNWGKGFFLEKVEFLVLVPVTQGEVPRPWDSRIWCEKNKTYICTYKHNRTIAFKNVLLQVLFDFRKWAHICWEKICVRFFLYQILVSMNCGGFGVCCELAPPVVSSHELIKLLSVLLTEIMDTTILWNKLPTYL